jgi:hypothetical protein
MLNILYQRNTKTKILFIFLNKAIPVTGREDPWGCVTSRHYATNRKIAGSSPDEVDFFNLPNPPSRTMALGLTQPLTEMSINQESS